MSAHTFDLCCFVLSDRYGVVRIMKSDYTVVITLLYVTRSEKTDHFVIKQIVQYGPKALPRSRSRDFAIIERAETCVRAS